MGWPSFRNAALPNSHTGQGVELDYLQGTSLSFILWLWNLLRKIPRKFTLISRIQVTEQKSFINPLILLIFFHKSGNFGM